MSEKMTPAQLADKIINEGYRIKRGDDLSIFLEADLAELEEGAGRIQKHFSGNHFDMCTIINGKSGKCPENCKYCAQSAHHNTNCETYPFLPKEEIIAAAKHNQDVGVNRFAIVTAGRALTGPDFEKALDVYREMNKTLSIKLCASMGLLSQEQFYQLKEAGVSNYHNNIETSRANFPNICTTHTFDDKVRTIGYARKAGLTVCSGGIIGLGESWEDRLDMAISLSEMDIASIPLNFLQPIPGSPMADMPAVTADDAMRTIALFRYINPEAHIRLAAGRKILPGFGKTAFVSGASATITGDMLTTSGTTIAGDFEILKELGLTNK
ncbi:MAG: biotin synthase BioB [Schwartzia sp.]|nr:biotin synthase BioB [Schwartzia sp. (in: firmicutes)]